jgi:hypothetical protein
MEQNPWEVIESDEAREILDYCRELGEAYGISVASRWSPSLEPECPYRLTVRLTHPFRANPEFFLGPYDRNHTDILTPDGRATLKSTIRRDMEGRVDELTP